MLAMTLEKTKTIDDDSIVTSFDETIEIQLTQEEINGIYAWCDSIEDVGLRNQVRQALDDTITSDGVLYIQELEQKLSKINHDPYPAENSNSFGILPAFPIVRCKWKVYSNDEAERWVQFWILGWGRHELTWDTLDDHDGDGDWDLGPGTPWHYEWFALMLPLRYYDDWCYWDGYPGRARVKVSYTVDDNSYTKTFYEPSSGNGKSLDKGNPFFDILENLFERLPIFQKIIYLLKN